MLKGADEVAGSCGGGVGAGGGGHGHLRREPNDGVGRGFRGSVDVPAAVTAIVFHGWAKIPAIFRVRRPGCSKTRFLVDLDSGAGRGKWGAVEIKGSMELFPRGEAGIDAGGAQKIETEDGLRQEFVPKVEGERRIGSAESCDEMVFEGPNGALGGVAAMIAGGNELVVHLLAVHVSFEHGGGFVVKSL